MSAETDLLLLREGEVSGGMTSSPCPACGERLLCVIGAPSFTYIHEGQRRTFGEEIVFLEKAKAVFDWAARTHGDSKWATFSHYWTAGR